MSQVSSSSSSASQVSKPQNTASTTPGSPKAYPYYLYPNRSTQNQNKTASTSLVSVTHSSNFPKTFKQSNFLSTAAQTESQSNQEHPMDSRSSSKSPSNTRNISTFNHPLRLDPNGLHDLYKKYGSNYKSVFENVAIDILTEEATKYTAYSFFWDRGNIKDQFQLVKILV